MTPRIHANMLKASQTIQHKKFQKRVPRKSNSRIGEIGNIGERTLDDHHQLSRFATLQQGYNRGPRGIRKHEQELKMSQAILLKSLKQPIAPITADNPKNLENPIVDIFTKPSIVSEESKIKTVDLSKSINRSRRHRKDIFNWRIVSVLLRLPTKPSNYLLVFKWLPWMEIC